MPGINVHVAHHEANFVDDGLARGFDAQHLPHLHHRVRFGRSPVDAVGVHAGAEAVAFDEKSVALLVVSLDDGAGCSFVAREGNIRQQAPDMLHAEEGFRVFLRQFALFALALFCDVVNIDAKAMVEELEVFGLQLQFAVFEYRFKDAAHGEIELEFVHGGEVDLDVDPAIIASPGNIDM